MLQVDVDLIVGGCIEAAGELEQADTVGDDSRTAQRGRGRELRDGRDEPRARTSGGRLQELHALLPAGTN